MSDTKKNHVVAQTYLKHFAIPGKTNFIHACTKTHYGWSKFKKESSIAEVGFYDDIYSVIGNDGTIDRRTLENAFNTLFENDWDEVINAIDNFPYLMIPNANNFANEIVFNPKQEKALTNFLHYQYKKSPRMKLILGRIQDEYPAEYWTPLLNENPRATLEEVKQIHLHRSFTSLLEKSLFSDSGEIENFLKKATWEIFVNKTSSPFITSTNPVIWHDELQIDGVPVIYTSITSKYAILIKVKGNLKQNSIIFTDINDQSGIEKLNLHTAYYSADKIFSGDRVYLEKFIENNPKLGFVNFD